MIKISPIYFDLFVLTNSKNFHNFLENLLRKNVRTSKLFFHMATPNSILVFSVK